MELAFDRTDKLCEERIRDRWDDHTDQAGRLGAKRAGSSVWPVVEPGDGGADGRHGLL